MTGLESCDWRDQANLFEAKAAWLGVSLRVRMRHERLRCLRQTLGGFGAIYDTLTGLLRNRLTVSGWATRQLMGGKPLRIKSTSLTTILPISVKAS
jgi:hypothetical protein